MTAFTLLSQVSRVFALFVFCISAVPVSAETVFHRGNIGEPDSLDPHLTTSGYATNIIFDMFIGLTTVDADVNIVPGAAESWTISEDGKTYVFTLREGMAWSDGTPVTASDFEFSFKRMLDPITASRGAPMLYMIENGRPVNAGQMPSDDLAVTAIDERTLEIRLEAPTPFFLELIVHRCFPVPRWVVEEHGREWTRAENIVVNGAFTLEEWVPQTSVKVVRNPSFFAADSVKLDAVVYYTTEDLSAAFNRYRAGELDMVISFPPAQLDWIKENLSDDLRMTQSLGLEYITFNTKKPPFDDPRVRLALSMALDRETLTDRVMRGGEIAAYSLIPEGSRVGYEPAFADYRDLSQAERKARAKALLAEAGYGPENPLSFSFRYNTQEVLRRVAAAAAAMWQRDLDVEVSLLNSDLNVLNADLRNGDYEVARYQWFGEHRDPSTFLYLLESDAVGDNHSKYSNPEFDRLMQQAYASADIPERMRLMQAAERIIMDEAPIAPLNYYVSKRLVKPYVSGLENNVRGINLGRYVSVERP
ncbi:MAG: peptide ABC transporter substrate-binding protein [Rhodospirillaceae bacterium]|jgi:oligopeptide transport system substrate-binding protein|nr:peptide ABC transporter substrate-binding protein [Rhodospirillaceae bacterium]MBT5239457.1 peptide ABC transporter substrate-binding protein [Rhodospirillaceae bacterium]MBT5564302.1 peptide ABC transporter substrate-binding protein [Rhodospirillaceae bacterium]MBT6088864.1 peptide ABC transporter substrate-binding protein [Rhodospirillaceae bacterium]MBT6960420.1 peptide ABC transporter substrate-binding protein [Rhodospirillaceae bacterium]